MICEDCKNCCNYHVSEVGCFGSNKPCEYCTPNSTCGNCVNSNDKDIQINGSWYVWCRKHKFHVAPNDLCEFWKKR